MSTVDQDSLPPEPQPDNPPAAGPALIARIPLTESQREVWLATQMQPEANLAYNEGLSLVLTGELRADCLQKALELLLKRHEMLRATISADGRWLSVRAELLLDLPVTECLGPKGQETLADAEAGEMSSPFDLQRGPLIRFQLLVMSPIKHVLLITAHHIIVDGWSAAVLLTELGTLYTAIARDETPELPPAPHYGDYVDAERAFINSPVGTAHADYWLDLLRDAPLPPEIPLDRPRPVQRTYSADRIDHRLDAGLVEAVRRLGTSAGTSLVATTLAAFAVLLRRVTGADDLVIGLAASGQSFHGCEQLVGHCVNFLPLRFRPAETQSFGQFLRAAQSTLLDAFEHQGATFGYLLPKLSIKRDPQRPPLVSVVFNLDVRDDVLNYAGLQVDYTTLIRQSETFELYFNLVSSGSELLVECSYNSDLFSADMIRARLDEFETLLRSACADPDCNLNSLTILSRDRRDQIVRQWNDTERNYLPDSVLPELLVAAANRWPDHPALVAENEVLTYRQLDERAEAVAGNLRARGVGPETIVGVCAHRSAEMVIALIGILKAGGAYLPLDPEYPGERLGFMVIEAGCHLVLASAGLLKTAAGWRAGGNCEVLAIRDLLAPIAHQPDSPRVATPDSLVYVLFTSGSTGRPKGTMLTHRGVINRLRWGQEQYPIGPGDRLLQKTPFSFDVSVPEFFWPLMNGATLVMARPDGHKDPAYLVETIQRERITSCHFVPSMLGPFLDHPHAASCVSLKHVFASGEALPYAHVRRFHDTLPQAELHNLYGPTEASVEVSYWDCPKEPDPRRLVPIGRPVANTQLRVLDHHGEVLPVGVVGELYLGGTQLARGYLNQPELTAERFIQHPEFGRLYRTGDLARWLPDGVVDFLGRADGQVKLRGFRIELGEIESQLKAQPEVTEAVVAVRERTGDDPRLVAWVALRPGAQYRPEELSAALGAQLPDYMIPQAFMAVADFPRLPSGKINRALLPDPFASLTAARSGHRAPEPGLESQLAALWQQILGGTQAGRADRFLDLGGHSLLAVRLAGRIEQEFGLRLPLRVVMMETLAGLARQLPGGNLAGTATPGVGLGAEVRQEACFFGHPNRQLFGVLSLPTKRQKRTAVLVCASWGPEYMRAYRALKSFADQLAQYGHAAMRFDYVGTGDSAGYSVEAGLEAWLDNVVTAAAELRRQSGADQLCVVGLRLGALLAERAVAAGLEASSVVLWDPPVDGKMWIETLRRFDAQYHDQLNSQRARHVRLPPSPANQLLGVPISEEFQRAIEGLNLEQRQEHTKRLLVLSADMSSPEWSGEVLQLPAPSYWSQLSWIDTPWNPAAGTLVVARKLSERLP